MESIIAIASIFVFLTFIHFIADWIFQTDWEAKHKTKKHWVRVIHCSVYTIFFLIPILVINPSTSMLIFCLASIWISHFFIDTYAPILIWASYIRKIPELQRKDFFEKEKSFVELFTKSPVYAVIFIMVDQILHISVLMYLSLFLAL